MGTNWAAVLKCPTALSRRASSCEVGRLGPKRCIWTTKTYVLTGPASISLHDVADGLTKALGKQVTYVDVPPEAAREAIVGMGMPEWDADGYLELFEGFSEGFADMTTPMLSS